MKSKIDPIWEEIHSTREWGAYPSEDVIRFVARNYYNRERKEVRILDFGCGQGSNTWYLAREGFNTYAFDGSNSAVKKTDRKLKKEKLRAELSVQQGTDIDYEKDFFDAVIDCACIYANTYDDIFTMYKNVFSVLKKGGKLLTICFGEDLYGYRTGIEIETGTFIEVKEGALRNKGITHIFNKVELLDLLKTVGFNILYCDEDRYTDQGTMIHRYICVAEKAK